MWLTTKALQSSKCRAKCVSLYYPWDRVFVIEWDCHNAIFLDILQTKDDGEQQRGGEDGHPQEHDEEVAADEVEVVLLLLVGDEDCGEDKAESDAELSRHCQHPSGIPARA